MIAYEMASSMIGVAMWCYLGGLIGLLWGCHGILGQMAQDRTIAREAKASLTADFLAGRHCLPHDLLDDRVVQANPEVERPVRISSTPGPMELRLLRAQDRARPVLTTALGYGPGRFQRRQPRLLLV